MIHALFATETRHITPPKLQNANIGKKVVCYRPMRHPIPNFSLEKNNGKTLIHNYGHGGSGWSLAPGSVDYCVSLLFTDRPLTDLHMPIAIVGSGCIGLFTAYKLLEKGFTDITLYSDSFDDLTSHYAGGLLSMRAFGDSPELHELFVHIGCESYRFYKKIAEGMDKEFKAGASLLPTYVLNHEQSELEVFVGKVMEPAKKVVLDFGNGVTRQMLAYDDSIFIDTGLMMELLTNLLKNRVTFVKKEIREFSDLDESIIFNCTGMGSRKLNHDNLLEPVQGHLVFLENQDPKELQYMMIMDWNEGVTSANQRISRTLDFFPKRFPDAPATSVGVLGGTFICGADETTPNDDEFELIHERAYNFFYTQSDSITDTVHMLKRTTDDIDDPDSDGENNNESRR